jgi:hypothetical protein
MLSRAFHEVKHNPPKQLAKTKRKFGAERAGKQRTAIAMNKARRGY